MSDRAYSKERDSRRSNRRRSPSTSPPPRRDRDSRSPSPQRPRRSPKSSSNNNDIHRENPVPSPVLGVFGLSQRTTEQDLKELFGKFGRVTDVQIVMDKKTNKSRGFGFIYFEEIDSATRAKNELNASELDHHRLRIDYSVTKRAHTPTPGVYMGVRPSSYYHRSNGHSYRRSPSPDRRSSHRRHRYYNDRSRSRSRTRSRSRSRTRSRSRSRSRHRGDRRRRSPGYA